MSQQNTSLTGPIHPCLAGVSYLTQVCLTEFPASLDRSVLPNGKGCLTKTQPAYRQSYIIPSQLGQVCFSFTDFASVCSTKQKTAVPYRVPSVRCVLQIYHPA